jgi:hypothetical protein
MRNATYDRSGTLDDQSTGAIYNSSTPSLKTAMRYLKTNENNKKAVFLYEDLSQAINERNRRPQAVAQFDAWRVPDEPGKVPFDSLDTLLTQLYIVGDEMQMKGQDVTPIREFWRATMSLLRLLPGAKSYAKQTRQTDFDPPRSITPEALMLTCKRVADTGEFLMNNTKPGSRVATMTESIARKIQHTLHMLESKQL